MDNELFALIHGEPHKFSVIGPCVREGLQRQLGWWLCFSLYKTLCPATLFDLKAAVRSLAITLAPLLW